jgi:hypothetical protein
MNGGILVEGAVDVVDVVDDILKECVFSFWVKGR